MKGNFFYQLFQRWGSENPKFWNKAKNGGLVMALLIAAVLGLHEYEIFYLPDNWHNLLSHLDTLFAGVWMTAAAGTTEPHLMDDKTIQNVKEDNKLR